MTNPMVLYMQNISLWNILTSLLQVKQLIVVLVLEKVQKTPPAARLLINQFIESSIRSAYNVAE